ncbi:hypothetical protein B0H65DRAFT_567075 [Neurospora tetraspora]|uniref:Uncharacterized protein n=1 Tax=Neurospora tetraspora TaxID=94610 RepID=A0AAE0JIU9_9PEZI|nr:hypothetical protein B0H65DRAFT_567075 [Neurospora tetraspora]
MKYLLDPLKVKRQLEQQGYFIPVFEFAETLHNIAFAAMGKDLPSDEVLRHSQKALDLISQVDGHTNDHTRFLFCRGLALYFAHRNAEALAVFEGVYQTCTGTFGALSSQARDAGYAVGFLLYTMGRPSEAQAFVEGCLIRGKEQAGLLWPKECRTRAKYLYSLILLALGNIGSGDRLRDEAIRELKGHLVAAFPGTLPTELNAALSFTDDLVGFEVFGSVVPFFAGRFDVYH